MATYQELMKQAKELEAKAAEERNAVIEKIKGELAAYEITAAELGLAPAKKTATSAKRGRPASA